MTSNDADGYDRYPTIPFVSGVGWKAFFDGHVLGVADMDLAGHDRSLRWTTPVRGSVPRSSAPTGEELWETAREAP